MVALADGPARAIRQEDVFLPHPGGRLKVRLLAEDCAELISYWRSDGEAEAQAPPLLALAAAAAMQGTSSFRTDS
ncbi:MAG: hypothetical protein RIC87_16605 [Kiloniellales bacterium]